MILPTTASASRLGELVTVPHRTRQDGSVMDDAIPPRAKSATARPRPKRLGRFAIDAQLREEFERSGLLDLHFARGRSDASLTSLDGHRSLLFLAPSGEIAGLLVQDYAPDEERRISFAIGEIELVLAGDELTVLLWPAHPQSG